jgi:hypothetical protein
VYNIVLVLAAVSLALAVDSFHYLGTLYSFDVGEIFKSAEVFGVPYGSRTRVAAVKGRCPRPLDERDAL